MFSQQARNTVTAIRLYGLALAIGIIINLCTGCGDDGAVEYASQDALQADTADVHAKESRDGSMFDSLTIADAIPDSSHDSAAAPDAAIVPRDTLPAVVIPDTAVPPSNACKYTWADDWMPDSVPCCHEAPATCASLFPQGSCKCPGALRCTINNFDAKPTPQPYHWRCKQ